VLLVSCKIYFRPNNQLSFDYNNLGNKEFARKYFTLFAENNTSQSFLDSKKVYRVEQNNFTFKYLVFSKDNWVYDSPLLSQELKNDLKLSRDGYYIIKDSIIKIEWVAQNPGSVYSIINEGVIRNDSIFLYKEYTGRKRGQKRILKIIKPDDAYENYNLMNNLYIKQK
jgi:hypothetical protein